MELTQEQKDKFSESILSEQDSAVAFGVELVDALHLVTRVPTDLIEAVRDKIRNYDWNDPGQAEKLALHGAEVQAGAKLQMPLIVDWLDRLIVTKNQYLDSVEKHWPTIEQDEAAGKA